MILKPYYNSDITLFAETNFRDQRKRFGIKRADRRHHMYLVGKAGMGKTSLIEHMIVQDMFSGQGLCVLDSDGALIEQALHYVPESRIKDVIYFNPSDSGYPFAFNFLSEIENETMRHNIVNGLMGVFKEVWSDVWGPRLEYVLTNALLTLSHNKRYTVLHLLPLLGDRSFRQKFISELADPVLVDFWQREYEGSPERFRESAVLPLTDKMGRIMSNPLVRNIIGQPKTSSNFSSILSSKKIVLLGLNRNEIGADAFKLLGGAFITRLLIQAKHEGKSERDFYMYLDEFQNVSFGSVAEFINTTDYGLNLILSNQYLSQIPEFLQNAIFGNVGTLCTFRLSGADADLLVQEFQPDISKETLLKLPKHRIALKLLIDGEASNAFVAQTLEPLPQVGLKERVISWSRDRYAHKREQVEADIVESLNIPANVSNVSAASDEDEDAVESAVSDSTASVEDEAVQVNSVEQEKPAPAVQEKEKPVTVKPKKNTSQKQEGQKREEQREQKKQREIIRKKSERVSPPESSSELEEPSSEPKASPSSPQNLTELGLEEEAVF